MSTPAFASAVEAIVPVRRNEPLSRHTTFGIGGPADVYAVAATEDELRRLTALAREYDIPCFILGSGSNILVGDGGIRGLAIENQVDGISEPQPNGEGLIVSAGSGVSFATLARRLSFSGYAGLEWASGIPGTLGGAVVYNAGAYGGCLRDVLVKTRLSDPEGRVAEADPDALAMGYRGSVFTRGLLQDRVVLSLDLRVYPGDSQELRTRVKELDARRTAAQPKGRNSGSVFKNPLEHPAWWLIDQVGLRGERIGDGQISEKHTNFFLNLGNAKAADITALMKIAQERVKERFDIDLEPEVKLVGEF
ncbi:MAG TPA: UDP-N-acetylmuramate dehydrogenase [Dehalococcoidia bacterium]|nr:UDP-N-acetylmuramate dehydrogenase [Dehalococcoidia bacterium]